MRNSQREKKLFFLCAFLTSILAFYYENKMRDSMEKAKAAGKKEKPDYSKSVQLLHAALFFSSVFLHPLLDHLGTEFINTG